MNSFCFGKEQGILTDEYKLLWLMLLNKNPQEQHDQIGKKLKVISKGKIDIIEGENINLLKFHWKRLKTH